MVSSKTRPTNAAMQRCSECSDPWMGQSRLTLPILVSFSLSRCLSVSVGLSQSRHLPCPRAGPETSPFEGQRVWEEGRFLHQLHPPAPSDRHLGALLGASTESTRARPSTDGGISPGLLCIGPAYLFLTHKLSFGDEQAILK